MAASPQSSLSRTRRPAVRTIAYSVVGVPISVSSNVADALERIRASYRLFEAGTETGAAEGTPAPAVLEVMWLPEQEAYSVSDSHGYGQLWPDADAATLDGLGRLTALVMAGLHARGGRLAVHAGAVVDGGEAAIVVGSSGAGKTTLTLGLVRRGLGFLSDELAVIETSTRVVVPYRRSLHIRPETVELVRELEFLRSRPRHVLGGGIEWELGPDELEEHFPGARAGAAPLGAVLALDGAPDPSHAGRLTPIPSALAAMELLRNTWKASVDFEGTMGATARLLGGARCARLEVGELEPTLDRVTAWLREDRP